MSFDIRSWSWSGGSYNQVMWGGAPRPLRRSAPPTPPTPPQPTEPCLADKPDKPDNPDSKEQTA